MSVEAIWPDGLVRVTNIATPAMAKITIPIKMPTITPSFISNYLIVAEIEKNVSNSIPF